jgi:hypothetical protein
MSTTIHPPSDLQKMTPSPRPRESDVLLGTAFALAVTATFLVIDDDTWHWFAVPVFLCGCIASIDALRVVRGRWDVFAPNSLVAVATFHIFFLAPFLHVTADYWPLYVTGAQDWRHSLGVLSVMNLLGLLAYKLGLRLGRPGSGRSPRLLDPRRLVRVLDLLIALCISSWIVLVGLHGGPRAYLQSLISDTADLQGMGTLLVPAEAWPILLAIRLAVTWRQTLRENPRALAVFFACFIIVQFFVSGLRGSRAATVWPLLIVLAICHVIVRRISRRSLAVAGLVILSFSWIYAFYKTVGRDVEGLLTGRTSISELSAVTNRDFQSLLLEDLSRTGVQGIIVDRLEAGTVQLGWGESYVGDVLTFLPDALFQTSVRSKVEFGTIALYGYQDDSFRSTRIYGLGGEAMLNFGWAGPLLAFSVFGIVVAKVRGAYDRALEAGALSAGGIVAPALCVWSLLLLISDLDNAILFGLKHVVPLAVAVLLTQERHS